MLHDALGKHGYTVTAHYQFLINRAGMQKVKHAKFLSCRPKREVQCNPQALVLQSSIVLHEILMNFKARNPVNIILDQWDNSTSACVSPRCFHLFTAQMV